MWAMTRRRPSLKLRADGGGHDCLLELDEVDLVAGLVGLLGVELDVAGILEHLLAFCGDLALGLAIVEELLVALGKVVGLLLDVGILVGDVSGLIEQLQQAADSESFLP